MAKIRFARQKRLVIFGAADKFHGWRYWCRSKARPLQEFRGLDFMHSQVECPDCKSTIVPDSYELT